MSRPFLLFLMTTMLLLVANWTTGQAQVVADSFAEFSGVQGQDNWYYGYYDGDSSPAYSTADWEEMPDFELIPPDIWSWVIERSMPGGFWTSIDDDACHPNSTYPTGGAQAVEHWAARRWVSEVAGSIRITGHVADKASEWGNGITAHIIIDGVEIWSQYIDEGDLVGVDYDVVASVTGGSLVDFCVSPGSTEASDGTQFTATIEMAGPATGNVVCTPDSRGLTATVPVNSVALDYSGGGSGPIYAYSIKFSWDGSIATTSPASVSEGTLLSALGLTSFHAHTTGTDEITIQCSLLGAVIGATGPGTFFDIEFTGVGLGTSPIDVTVLHVRDRYNNPLTGFVEEDGELVVDIVAPTVTAVQIANTTLAHTDDFVKDTDAVQVTATVTDDDPSFGIGSIEADTSGLGGSPNMLPTTYDTGTGLATWVLPGVTCSPSDGIVTVTVTGTDPIGNTGLSSDSITSDNTTPEPITGFTATPHHEGVLLSWDDPSSLDTNLRGVLVRYDVGGTYPEYGTLGNYPVDETGGTGTASDQPGAVTGDDHDIDTRDIYYYGAFVYDEVLHHGPADAGAQGRATNYWLGDVAFTGPSTGPYDGYVEYEDISLLSGTYWLTSGEGGYNNHCDVGPTDDWSRVGIPLPDDFIEFEDLVIFAMNYNIVTPFTGSTPDVQLAGAGETGQPALQLLAIGGSAEVGEELVVSLALAGNDGDVKAVSVELAYDPRQVQLENTRMNESLADGVFFITDEARPGTVKLDLAVLGRGRTLHGTGELARLTYRVRGDGDQAIRFVTAKLRGADNEMLAASHDDLRPDANPSPPLSTRLRGARPNPFNPATSVRYDLDQPAAVRLQVYDPRGRLVQTLVNGNRGAGSHTAVWDGLDIRGQAAGSGVYLVRIRVGEYDDTVKIVLVR